MNSTLPGLRGQLSRALGLAALLAFAPAPTSRPTPTCGASATISGDNCRLRELWSGRDLGEFTGQFGVEIPDHAAGLLRVAPQAGR
jgi:hypothetical protein